MGIIKKRSVFLVSMIFIFQVALGNNTIAKAEDGLTKIIDGGFETGDNCITKNVDVTNKFVSNNDNYELINNDKNSGECSLKFGKKKSNETTTISYITTKLKPNTKYKVKFYGKVAKEASVLSFKIAGYKNENLKDINNFYNYIEHTNIKNTSWSEFSYDFETGERSTKALVEFKTNLGGIAFIDDVSIEELGNCELKASNPTLSRGSKLIIDKGLQIQAWTPTDEVSKLKAWMKYPLPEEVLDLGLTALQYNDAPNYNSVLHEKYKELQKSNSMIPDLKWGIAWGPEAKHLSSLYFDDKTISQNDKGKTGRPTDIQKEKGFLTEEQLKDLNNLNNITFGDEENYSDTLTQTLKEWFDLSKKFYPNVMVHHNEVGNTPPSKVAPISTFNEDMLRKYVRTAKPDFITYDMYYFREQREEQEIGGTIIPFYNDLNRYRKIASEGYDGTGNSPIPFGKYMQGWRTGPGAATPEKRGDGWYETTESQIYLDAFATWTFGGKWLSIFRWIKDSPQYLFYDSKVDENGNVVKYHLYDKFKEMIRQSKNLGEHLVRINNKDVLMVPGKHKLDGAIVKNDRPLGNAEWNKNLDRAYIDRINVKNLGPTNDGLPGDVFLGYFEPLPGLDTTKFFTSTSPKYFMILNGLTHGNGKPVEEQRGSSYETRQEIKVTFDLSSGVDSSKLKKVSRLTGKVADVPLNYLGNGKYEMTLEIGGGMADLFFWELGNINTDNMKKNYEVEENKDYRLIGDSKEIKKIENKNFNGRKVTIGWIEDTYDPRPQIYNNINIPYSKDAKGNLILKPAGIAAYHSRDYERDLWERRVEKIQKENNVKLEFVPNIKWTKEELMENINKTKSGKKVSNMPDILIVPDEWACSGLIKNNMILPANSFKEFNFNDKKWNKSYKDMTTFDEKIYGMYAGTAPAGVGIFVNKTLLKSIGIKEDLQQLQKNGDWNWQKLMEIKDKLKNNLDIKDKYLFANTDALFKQIVCSNNVTPGDIISGNRYNFNISNENFKEALNLYSSLCKDQSIVTKPEDKSDDWYLEEFKNGNILFLVMPYDNGVDNLKEQYVINDVKVNMEDNKSLGKSNKVPVITDITDIKVEAGKYAMNKDDWYFIMFPKGPNALNYSNIIDKPSYPVMLSSVNKPEEVAYIWNKLTEEFTGVQYDRFLNRYLNQRRADFDTLRKMGY